MRCVVFTVFFNEKMSSCVEVSACPSTSAKFGMKFNTFSQIFPTLGRKGLIMSIRRNRNRRRQYSSSGKSVGFACYSKDSRFNIERIVL